MPNCPKCKEVKTLLDSRGIEYKTIDVMQSQNNKDLAVKYKVRSGGTVIDDETGEVFTIWTSELLNNHK
jgi:glutaredoxin